MIAPDQRQILQALYSAGPSSRWELHERTGQTPNRVGLVVEALVRQGLVRERPPETQRVGRPRVPIEIDPAGQHLIGLAVNPGGFAVCRMSLTGDVLEHIETPTNVAPDRLIPSAAKVLASAIDEDRTFGVGVSVTGFIDATDRNLLFSSSVPGQKPVSLKPLDRAAGRPVVLGNDMHALAARWAMTRRDASAESVLLVWFDDGRLGSAFLVDGRPYRGALAGGNELGHVRCFVETERCFCGHTGCLERIVSSDFLRRHGQPKQRASLPDRVEQFTGTDAALELLLKYLCGGLANAVNLLRPQRLVLASRLAGQAAFRDAIAGGTRDLLLRPLQDLVAIEFWNRPVAESAVDAAWLAAADLLWTGWNASSEAPAPRLSATRPKR